MKRKRGSTSNMIRVFIQDNTLTTGKGLTGLTFESTNLQISVIRELSATPTLYTGANIETITAIGTFQAPSTSAKCRFKAIDATNRPGEYEIHFHDDAGHFGTGDTSKNVQIRIDEITTTALNIAPCLREIDLVAYDEQDIVRLGLTSLPNAAADGVGGLPISDAGGLDIDAILADTNELQGLIASSKIAAQVKGTDDIDFSTTQKTSLNAATPASVQGAVASVTGAVGSVTGNVTGSVGSISGITFPTNFAALSISVGGLVDILQTAADKVWGTTARTLTALGSSLVAEIWNAATSGMSTVGSIGKKLADWVVGTIDTYTGNTKQTGNVGVAGAGLTDLGGMSTTMKAQVNTEADTALTDYDPPTRAEATTDKDAIIAEVNANEAKIDIIDTIVDKVDSAMVLDVAVYQFTANALELAPSGTGLTAQQTRDAMKLAPTAGDPAAGSIDKHEDDILEDTGTTLPATLKRIINQIWTVFTK